MGTMGLYSIQDVLTGFKTPFIRQNHEVARRDYKLAMQGEATSKDCRLFYLGSLNIETGVIKPQEPPECIEGGILNGV